MSGVADIFTPVLKSGLTWMSRRALPVTHGLVVIDGLQAPVEILRDTWGVPHIYAKNEHDLFYAMGFAHAQDRLWQMELFRRTAEGRLAELFGKLALDTDRAARTFGFDRLGQADWAILDDASRATISAYTQGINAWLTSPFYKAPVEFTLLGHKPALWSEADSMAFSRLMFWQLSHAWYSEIIRAQLVAAVGEEHAAEWEIEYPPQNPEILPKGCEFNRLTPDGALKGVTGPFLDRGKGSNCWTVAGAKSVTGKPYLCNDMHLVLSLPTIWYEAHLNGGGIHMNGVTMPGIPLVLVGHNERVAWGITLAFTDCEDLFIEKFDPAHPNTYEYKGEWLEAEVIPEKIRVKGEKEPFVENVVVTRHGPVISDVVGYPEQRVATHSMALRPTLGMKAWLMLSKAKEWNDFVEAMRLVNATQLNISYADVDGNIGYWATGETPIRARGDGTRPVPGWTGEYEWVGSIPFEEMPHALNPESGYLLTCNHRIVPQDYPYFLGNVWMNGYRAKRLVEMLESRPRLGPDDFNRMQMDLTCLSGLEFVRALDGLAGDDEESATILKMLREWDGQLTVDSVAGTLYEVLRYTLIRGLIEPKLGKEMSNHLMGVAFNPVLLTDHEYFGYDTVSLLRLLQDPQSWWVLEAGGREAFVNHCIHQTAAYLRQKLGSQMSEWQWGRLHCLTFAHAMGIQKPLDQVFNRGPFPMGGDTDTPLQSAITAEDPYDNKLWSPSVRFVMDLEDFSRSKVVTPVGQSGQLGSPHYDDMIPLYLNGKYHPMLWTRQQVEENLEGKLTLNPK